MKRKNWLAWPLLLCAVVLSACGKGSAPTEPETTMPTDTEVAMVVTADTIGELENYPALRKADLTGSTCYQELAAYAQAHPQVEVIYTVDLGGATPGTDVTELTLDEYEYGLLLENLRYLPALETVNFPKIQMTGEELGALRDAYPELEIRYTLELLGEEVAWDCEELDLSAMTAEDMEAVTGALALLPKVGLAKLSDENGKSNLTVEEVHALQEAAPDLMFDYTFELFGKKVSTMDERVEFKNKKIGDKKEPELRQALDIMKGCQYMLLEHCYLSDEVLAQLREDYRGRTKIVWRIYFAKGGSCTTDRTVLRYVYNVTNSTVKQLKYCEDVEYIDFGHNEILSDWSWVANMPKLKAIIVSGSIIRDLTPFANCKELEFLELSNCGLLTDASPLAACESLKRLNISYTHIEDLSPLDDLDLECFVYVKPKASEEELERFEQLHPECLTQYKGNEYSYPWRYDENGDPNPYYEKLKEVFHYPDAIETTW